MSDDVFAELEGQFDEEQLAQIRELAARLDKLGSEIESTGEYPIWLVQVEERFREHLREQVEDATEEEVEEGIPTRVKDAVMRLLDNAHARVEGGGDICERCSGGDAHPEEKHLDLHNGTLTVTLSVDSWRMISVALLGIAKGLIDTGPLALMALGLAGQLPKGWVMDPEMDADEYGEVTMVQEAELVGSSFSAIATMLRAVAGNPGLVIEQEVS